jgi:hypothetical protein
MDSNGYFDIKIIIGYSSPGETLYAEFVTVFRTSLAENIS